MKMNDRHNNQKAGARPSNEGSENITFINMVNNNYSAMYSPIEGTMAGVTTKESMSKKNTTKQTVSVARCMRELHVTADELQWLVYWGARAACDMDDPEGDELARKGMAMSWMLDHNSTTKDAVLAGLCIVDMIKDGEV